MDVSSEVKQKPKRFKKNYGVSTISLATIIFWMPTAFVFIVKFYVGKNIPIWIAIISSVLCIILGIIDLEIGNMEKTTHTHFLSTISIIVSTIVIAICIVYMVMAHYVNQITDGISSNIESFNSEVDEYNNQQESAPTGNSITVKVGDGLTYGEAAVDLVKCYEYTDFDEWNAPKDGYKVVVFELSAKNDGTDNFYFSASNAEGYADNKKVEQYYMDSDIQLDLSKGRTGTGTIAFEVPKDSKDIQMDYTFNSYNGDTGVFIYSE